MADTEVQIQIDRRETARQKRDSETEKRQRGDRDSPMIIIREKEIQRERK